MTKASNTIIKTKIKLKIQKNKQQKYFKKQEWMKMTKAQHNFLK